MRKLNTKDAVNFMRLLKKAGVRQIVVDLLEDAKTKPEESVEKIGINAVFALLEGVTAAEAETELYKFLSGPFEKTPEYFARAKVYLCTSAVEGFPNTFLQSWYARAGVVSVTFSCDGVLQKYDAGVLSNSEANAADDIVKLLSDEPLRRTLCDHAFEYLRNNHTPEQTLAKFEELINE